MDVFPLHLFEPTSLKAEIVGADERGGKPFSGPEQVGPFDIGGTWEFTLGEMTLWERDQVMAWRAMESALDNGAGYLLLPICDRLHAPVVPACSETAFAGGELFDDGSSWVAAEVDAILSLDAAQGARSLTFSVAASPLPIQGGEFFSILHVGGWRLYRIVRRIDNGGGSITAEIEPPLRKATAAGTPLNFDEPRVVVRLDGDPGAVLEMLKFGRAGPIKFKEAFPTWRHVPGRGADIRKYRLVDRAGLTSMRIPSDWKDTSSWLWGVGGGGGGSLFGFPISAKSGGGGGFALEDRAGSVYSFSPDQLVPIGIGAGGAPSGVVGGNTSGGDTWIGSNNPLSASSILIARGAVGFFGGGTGGSGLANKGPWPGPCRLAP